MRSLLGIYGTPPFVPSVCFRLNLTANQHGDYERMRCRHHLIVQIFAVVSKIVAVTASSEGRFSQLCLQETLPMFHQFLTAVVTDMCLQDFMTARSGSLVQK